LPRVGPRTPEQKARERELALLRPKQSRKPRTPEGKAREAAAKRAKYAADPVFRAELRAKENEANRLRPKRALTPKRAAVVRRRGRLRDAEGNFTTDDIRAMLVAQDHACKVCRASLSNGYDIDHKHPLSRGGSNWPSNLQLLCAPCNRSKHDKTMDEWAEWKLKVERYGAAA
jgi:5-methylcytosine-specific restriction endonuclease McrA